jgi:hypothetical protein
MNQQTSPTYFVRAALAAAVALWLGAVAPAPAQLLEYEGFIVRACSSHCFETRVAAPTSPGGSGA